MSDLASWGSKLRGAVAHTRAAEAQRTHLFEQRATRLWRDCYERLLLLQEEANAALRSSNLILRVTRGEAEKLSAWIKLEICGLDSAGAAMDTVRSVRIHTSTDNAAIYEPPISDLPALDLDDAQLGSLQDTLFAFVISGLRSSVARP